MYEEIVNMDGSITIKYALEENKILLIPSDESNSDYQKYLAWKSENP